MKTPEDWHQRYTQQARWTKDIRRYLFAQVQMERARRVLEVGCGTGAVLSHTEAVVPLGLNGVDLNLPGLRLAQQLFPLASLTAGNALSLPYAAASFDIAFCHFLLLWIHDPLAALAEMKRVTRPGGYVLALAEPDYGGRIDHPASLETIGKLQAQALADQGADPLMGRKLGGLLNDAGLSNVQVGLIGGFWNHAPAPEDLALEWEVLGDDLADRLPASTLQTLQQADLTAWQEGRRILYVPTFYGWGQVPA